MLLRWLQIFNNGYFIKRSMDQFHEEKNQIRTRRKKERKTRREREERDTNTNDNFLFLHNAKSRTATRGGKRRESTGAHRIVSRFITLVVWNNESTEMSNLLALSAHDERRERNDCHGGASRTRRCQTRWWYFNPLTERNFPPFCIFLWPVFLSRSQKQIS